MEDDQKNERPGEWQEHDGVRLWVPAGSSFAAELAKSWGMREIEAPSAETK